MERLFLNLSIFWNRPHTQEEDTKCGQRVRQTLGLSTLYSSSGKKKLFAECMFCFLSPTEYTCSDAIGPYMF